MSSKSSVSKINPYQETFYAVLQDVKKLVPKKDKSHGERFGCYDFVINCTNYHGTMTEQDLSAMYVILAVYEEEGSSFVDDDTAFVAFYLICLYLYRRKRREELHFVLEKYARREAASKKFAFADFPVLWDLSVRFCVVNDDYITLLKCSLAGKKAMPSNPSIGVSYVDGVCSWLSALYYDTHSAYASQAMPNDIGKLISTLGDFTLDEDGILLAIKYDVEAINFNPSYAKYYYYLAQLYFYYRYAIREGKVLSDLDKSFLDREFSSVTDCNYVSTLTRDDVVGDTNFKLREELKLLTEMAKARAKTSDERAKYQRFLKLTESYFSDKSNALFAFKNKVIKSNTFEECKDVVCCSQGTPYAIVSYSRRNYKSVFCDILELQDHGVNIVFDDKLVKMDGGSGDTWIKRYESLLKEAKIVICYLSKDYLKSPSVMQELDLIRKYNKKFIAIDLTGKLLASKIIASIINDGGSFSSENLNLITSLFTDDGLVFEKPPVDDSPAHIGGVISRLKAECADLVNEISVQSAQTVNLDPSGKPYHPMEDRVYVNQPNNIFIVADGITRNEGYCGEESIAKMVTDYFCEALDKNLSQRIHSDAADIGLSLESAFEQTTKDVAAYVAKNKAFKAAERSAKERCIGGFYEKPGCVFVGGVVYNHRLYYGHVGDCGLILVRNNQKYVLATPQTYFAFKVQGAERQRKLLYDEYVNRPENKNGYGVVNGDPGVVSFFNVTMIDLQTNDTLYFVSDGIYPFIAAFPPAMYNDLSPEEILSLHKKYYPTDKKLDDRAIIKVCIARKV